MSGRRSARSPRASGLLAEQEEDDSAETNPLFSTPQTQRDRATRLLPEQHASSGAAQNLFSRFSRHGASHDDVAEALDAHGGHAGRASGTLRAQFAPDEQSPAPPEAEPELEPEPEPESDFTESNGPEPEPEPEPKPEFEPEPEPEPELQRQSSGQLRHTSTLSVSSKRYERG
jgi:hypothetical protein